MSSVRHKFREPRGKYVITSEKERKKYEGIIAESNPNRRSEKTNLRRRIANSSDLTKTDGKLVHVDLDKEVARTDEKTVALSLLPNKSGEKKI